MTYGYHTGFRTFTSINRFLLHKFSTFIKQFFKYKTEKHTSGHLNTDIHHFREVLKPSFYEVRDVYT